MFLSVIIPVYNAEKYIGECLDSILHQKFSHDNYEIICVNDGSVDGSLQVLCQYKEKYRNISVITIPNSGVSCARNLGLDLAKGDYIWFIDADDFTQPNALNYLSDTVQIQDYDRVRFDSYSAKDALSSSEFNLFVSHQLQSNNQHIDNGVVWSSIFRREFLQANKLTFHPDLYYAEDTSFTLEFSLLKPNVFHLNKVLYFYRHISTSAIHSKGNNFDKRILSNIKVVQIARKHLNAENSKVILPTLLYSLRSVLVQLASIPYLQAKPYLKILHTSGLFPYHFPQGFSITDFAVAPRTGKLGNIYNYIYSRITTYYGFILMKLCKLLIKLK